MTEPVKHSSSGLFYAAAQSRAGLTLLILGFCGFIVLGLYPFDWDPPSHERNGAVFNSNGGLEFREAGVMIGKGPPSWVDAARRSRSFSLSLRLRPFTVRPGEPDRIVTFSRDHIVQNFMVGQDGRALVLRLKGPREVQIGRLVTKIDDVFTSNQWTRIEVAIEDDRLTVVVDDDRRVDRTLPPENSLEHWNDSFLLALGNESMGRRPWFGEIAEARISVGQREHDLLRSEDMLLPARYWSAPFAPRLDSIVRLHSERKLIIDHAANFICFVPLGFLLAARIQHRKSVLVAALICGFASLSVETVQIFIDRDPSIYDWVLNFSGGAAGALLAGHLRRRWAIEPASG